MISILYYSLSKEEEDISNNGSTNSSSSSIQLCFYYFIGKITKLKKLYIHPKICYEAVLKLLEGPTFLDNIIKDRLPNELILSDDEKELEKSDFLINIIKSCEKKITKHQMEEIIRIAEISQLYSLYLIIL